MRAIVGLVMSLLASACTTISGLVGGELERAGVKQPTTLAEARAMAPAAQDVTLRIHAGEALNVDPQLRPLSVVVRLYRLKSAEAFVRAPLAAFRDTESEKAAFGADVIAVREIVLTPRQRYEVVESLPLDVHYVGVAALFRAPNPQRWHFAFEKDAAAKTGITVGAHACALSVSLGLPVLTAAEFTRLVDVRCEPERG